MQAVGDFVVWQSKLFQIEHDSVERSISVALGVEKYVPRMVLVPQPLSKKVETCIFDGKTISCCNLFRGTSGIRVLRVRASFLQDSILCQ